MSDSADHTLRWRGRQSGPFSLQEINRQLDEHEIGMGHEILHRDRWISLEEFFAAQKPPAGAAPVVRMVTKAAASALPIDDSPRSGESPAPPIEALAPPARRPATPAAVLPPRRRLVYALLAALLGFAGLHNYYGRHWLTGVLQLLLSVATYLLGFGVIAPWLWAMVEAVVVRKDGRGLEMI